NTTDTVRTMATQFLWVFALVMPLQAFSHGCYFTIRSGGKTLITMIFDCVFMWCVSVSIAYVLANFTQMPIIPLYATVQLLEAIKCIIGFILIKKGIWINNIVE
ncbi:MAG: MATE family efflux transporter, partial [Acutalibacteraceae bacterium]|nr:MATE family efflux transporter [Acutalibacteraceae bacterium]